METDLCPAAQLRLASVDYGHALALASELSMFTPTGSSPRDDAKTRFAQVGHDSGTSVALYLPPASTVPLSGVKGGTTRLIAQAFARKST